MMSAGERKAKRRVSPADKSSMAHKFRDEQSKMYDTAFRFSIGENLSKIASVVGIDRHKVIHYLQRAFLEGIVNLPLAAPGELARQLQERFEGVRFCIIAARNSFGRLAAAHAS